MSTSNKLSFPDITDRVWQRNLLRSTYLPFMQKAVLNAINDRGGYRVASDRRLGIVGCTASHATLARDIGVAAETVGRALRQLKKAGLVISTKQGCPGGSILEDKRICWSNLDALWQQQQENARPSHPEARRNDVVRVESGIDSDIHSDNEADIDSGARSDKTDKHLNNQESTPSSPPTQVLLFERLPEGWGRVAKALNARNVRARKQLCKALAKAGVPIALVLTMINTAGKDVTPAGLYHELSQIGPDDIEDFYVALEAKRELAKQIRFHGELEKVGEERIVAKLQKCGVLEFDQPSTKAPN